MPDCRDRGVFDLACASFELPVFLLAETSFNEVMHESSSGNAHHPIPITVSHYAYSTFVCTYDACMHRRPEHLFLVLAFNVNSVLTDILLSVLAAFECALSLQVYFGLGLSLQNMAPESGSGLCH